jgi:hypothetical protein
MTNTLVAEVSNGQKQSQQAWEDFPKADVQRQASAGARDGVKGKEAISLRALRCMR